MAWAVAARYPTMVERLVVAAAPPTQLFTRNLTLEQMGRSFYFLWFLVRGEMRGEGEKCNL